MTILAPYEQYRPVHHPGLVTGAPPAPMQLFDLQNDPGEQIDVTEANPDVVTRLRREYDRLVKDQP